METLMVYDDLVSFLSERLEQQLPSFQEMLQHLQSEYGNLKNHPWMAYDKPTSETDWKICSVMILIYNKNGSPYFIITERQEYSGRFSAQLCLPGGKFEKRDISLAETALRETFEEINVNPEKISILSELSTLYGLNLEVHAYIGISDEDISQDFQPQEREVANIFELPISMLFSKKHNKLKVKSFGKFGNFHTPVLVVDSEKEVYGLTLQILLQLKLLLIV